jgi:hypothetical protein
MYLSGTAPSAGGDDSYLGCYHRYNVMRSEKEIGISVQTGSERRRHSRFPLTASIKVIESKSGVGITGRTNDLGLGGCYVDCMNSFPVGADVLVRIMRGEDLFETQAKVAYSQIGMGMGLEFVSTVPAHRQLLQKWLSEISREAATSQKPSVLLPAVDGKPPNKRLSTPSIKSDRVHPDIQPIPREENTPRSSSSAESTGNPTRAVQIVGALAAIILVGVAMARWEMHWHGTLESSSPQAAAAIPSETVPHLVPLPSAPNTDGTSKAATTEELTKPWAAKKFTFVKPLTGDSVAAMVIRLPNRSLWAFALQEPYGRCDLEFVTDLDHLSKQYGYSANHPMVANPCDGTIYDPLKLGSIGENVWVNGEVVQGGGLRPPISINVQVRGHSIIADRIE